MKHLLIISLFFSCLKTFSQPFSEIVKGTALDRAEDDRMGYAVTIDGNFAAIGAYGDDFGGSNPNMGSVYIYEMQGLNNWVEVQKLTASDQDDYDRFGWSVDMMGDYLVVGAYGEDDDENDANPLSKAGSAYIFQKIGGTWTEIQKIVASDRDADDEFGWSVSIYNNTLAVGAHIEDHDASGGDFKYHSGSVYLFEPNSSGIWEETQKIVANDRWVDMVHPNGNSGEDLADQFGGSVALWKDYLVVGAHSHDYATTSPLSGGLWTSGAAYIFERTSGTWIQVQKIQNSDREGWDRFGYSVAIDTNVIAVSAYSEDEDANGNNALTNPGSVYIFERNTGGSWNEVQKIVPNDRSSGDHFGYSIDIDDTLMILGCHSDDHDEFITDIKVDAGSAYLFEKNGGIWSQHQKIDASDRAIDDDFGISVGIYQHTALVGAQYNDFNSIALDSLDDAGAAYFFSNKICPIIVTNINPTICSGSSYTVGTSTYTTPGNYTDILSSYEGCDSTVHTNLIVTPPITADNYVSICHGESYTIGSSTYTINGNYVDVFTTSNGCDSTVNTFLTIENEIITDVYATMCYGATYYIFGTPTTIPGNYSYILTAQNGCDSTVITHLTMDPLITSENYVSICYGDSYTIGTSTYNSAGTYEDIVSATNFCDSTIITYLSVQLPSDASISQNMSILTANETGATYQWFDCENGNSIVGANSQVFNATYIGDFGVIVTKNGCSDTSACVHVSNIIIGIENKEIDEIVNIFPNPSDGNLTIVFKDVHTDGQLIINDSAGKLIMNLPLNKNEFQLTNLSSGLYVVEVRIGNTVSRKQLIIY